MPHRAERRTGRLGVVGRLLTVLVLLAGALLTDSVSQAAAVPAGPAIAVDGEVIGGVKVDDVVTALSDDHVAVIGSRANEAALAQVVTDARNKGLEFSVVSLSARLTDSDTRLLAEEVRSRVGGTVLVLTPVSGWVDSSKLSGSQQDAAKAAAKAAGDDDVAAARAFVDSATDKGFPVFLVVIGAVILVILIAIGAGIWQRRRRKETDAETLADLSKGLAERLGKLAPLVLSIPPRLEVAHRLDLDARFNAASGDYSRLQATIATPLGSRREIDATTAEIADLEKRMVAVDQELDTLLPGLEPPSPAG